VGGRLLFEHIDRAADSALGDLAPGESRELTDVDVELLRTVGDETPRPRPREP
jgi:hypothetical protein